MFPHYHTCRTCSLNLYFGEIPNQREAYPGEARISSQVSIFSILLLTTVCTKDLIACFLSDKSQNWITGLITWYLALSLLISFFSNHWFVIFVLMNDTIVMLWISEEWFIADPWLNRKFIKYEFYSRYTNIHWYIQYVHIPECNIQATWRTVSRITSYTKSY